MPGIVGLITRRPAVEANAEVARMLAAVRHEPFYASGTWTDESLGLYLAWTARPNSFSDHMPVRNEAGTISLVFSGEEFSDRSTSCSGAESAPAGYLLERYENEPGFPMSLNGLFHGVVADRNRCRVVLFNDRYGMHRLYFHHSSDTFYFAAEAKAILAIRPELRRLDAKGLGEFVACSCVLENRTLFPGIEALPAGAAWTFCQGTLVEKRQYFQPEEWERQPALDPETGYRKLRAFFENGVPRYFNGREPVGVALTGGMDTRLLMAWQKAQPRSLQCYTFGGMLRESEDVRVARRVAAECSQPHRVITVGSEFLAHFPRYAERSIYLTEGGVDVYRASDLFVSEQARQIAPVKVVGTYGSEILRHAVMFKPVDPVSGIFRPELLAHVQCAQETYFELRRQHPVTFAVFRQSPWYHSGILALEQSQLTVRSPFLDNDFVRNVFRLPRDSGLLDIRPQLIRDGSLPLARLRTDRVAGVGAGALAKQWVRAYLGATFKAEYAYDYGMPQWAVRVDRALRPLHLERAFLGRHKLTHFRWWYREQLAGYVREVLLDRAALSRPYLNPQAVRSLVAQHVGGERNHTTAIHKLLTLELLHRLFVDSR